VTIDDPDERARAERIGVRLADAVIEALTEEVTRRRDDGPLRLDVVMETIHARLRERTRDIRVADAPEGGA
jgi:hypothetical protein